MAKQSHIVLHIDMDAFFAAVEERDHPDVAGMPIVVGADPKDGRGRGIVATANYEARKYGIHSAQPISKAWKACKKGEKQGGKRCIFFQGNHKKYARESQKIMEIIEPFTERFEQVSIDEAYGELPRGTDWEKTEALAKRIKEGVLKETQLTCSVGVGPNRLVAKIASGLEKPDGLTVVREQDVQEVFDELSVRDIPGIGPKTEAVLKRRGIHTVRELRKIPEKKLEAWFGRWGISMARKARGQDDTPVGEERETKSVGKQHTFMQDVRLPEVLLATIETLAEEVGRETEHTGVQFQEVTLMVRFEDFTTVTRQTTLEKPAFDVRAIEENAMRLFLPFLDSRENPDNKAFRLLGVRVGKLSEKR